MMGGMHLTFDFLSQVPLTAIKHQETKKIFAIDSAFLHFPLRSSSLLVICLAINIWNDPEERERCSV